MNTTSNSQLWKYYDAAELAFLLGVSVPNYSTGICCAGEPASLKNGARVLAIESEDLSGFLSCRFLDRRRPLRCVLARVILLFASRGGMATCFGNRRHSFRLGCRKQLSDFYFQSVGKQDDIVKRDVDNLSLNLAHVSAM